MTHTARPGLGAGAGGRLVLVGTPLGNLGDLSPRARETILGADLVLCEDTRSLVRLFGAEVSLPPRESCFAANERGRVPLLLARLGEGKTVVFVSEAGMPGWSDPGRALVEAAAGEGFAVDVVPGPTAAATAVSLSGFSAKGARFVGFVARDGAARREALGAVAEERGATIFYESGPRSPALLADLAAIVPAAETRRAVVARELTKLHQEVLRGSVAALALRVTEPLRGEVTIVVEGTSEPPTDPRHEAARAVLEVMLARDLKPRQKAKRLAELTGFDANELYRRLGVHEA